MDSTSPSVFLYAGPLARLRPRLAPGKSDTLGIAVCRLLALPAVELFIVLRLHPAAVTLGSTAIFLGGVGALIAGWPMLAGVGVAGGALLDFADGMVARRTGQASVFGFRLDYIMDRIKSLALFGGMVFTSESAVLLGASLAAAALLVVRELVAWVMPIRQVSSMLGRGAWEVVFGRWHRGASELLRNDPWQLVLAGLVTSLAPRFVVHAVLYYYLTLLVDSAVFFRSFVAVGPLRVPGHSGRLVLGAEGRIKTAVLAMIRSSGKRPSHP